MGGAQITTALSEGLNLPFSLAEQVKRQVLVTLEPTSLDYYEVVRNGKLEKVSALKANEIAKQEIDDIINSVRAKLDAILEVNDYDTLYLTGGGIAYLKGIKCYLEKALKRNIEIITPKQVKFALPDLSSVVSLLDTALKMEDN